MVARIDITGQVFGRLTVIEFEGARTKGGGSYYKARCECGTIISVHRGHLLKGNTKSCGCYRKEVKRGPSLIGAKSYLLTVISEHYVDSDRDKRVVCSCACGNETTLFAYDFIAENTKSCGCYTKALNREGIGKPSPKRVDLTGKRFSKLLVTGLSESRKHHLYWNVLCDCGNTAIKEGSGLKSGATKTCGSCK